MEGNIETTAGQSDEIERCGRAAVACVNGIHVCERCRIDFVSVGDGAVYFSGRWHGVLGATYSAKQIDAYPGIAQSLAAGA